MKNIVYQTEELRRLFEKNRVHWEQFYDSEKKIITKLNPNSNSRILDIGCGCGGLGLALKERFGVNHYTGVDINSIVIDTAKQMNPNATFVNGDILDLIGTGYLKNEYDIVFSLSCVDWNIQFSDMLKAAWSYVKPGGYFISTFRLTLEKGCKDLNRSFQYINYDGLLEGEVAAYVVLNAKELLNEFNNFQPSEIRANGYWGKPSATAITPYKQLCFTAFSIAKGTESKKQELILHLDLPTDVLKQFA
ncbi:trans-aconitate 2-methyltransferase [Leptospira noguchii]|uniref:class I SAM-dependent methyltransferase n=1 Tax=Leptospira noguchii TaxID=28182 RepID=UPI00114616A8|nr:class I SAM-dependent methyltransferase [Leptospira noguchii]TQE84046.1 class I SAM-dependent methyltransferase [Leptospira noguchii]UOG54021.1 class I SAM-dependent methyltransferase [Leptospira noguchii]